MVPVASNGDVLWGFGTGNAITITHESRDMVIDLDGLHTEHQFDMQWGQYGHAVRVPMLPEGRPLDLVFIASHMCEIARGWFLRERLATA
jgi:hypothetical protein